MAPEFILNGSLFVMPAANNIDKLRSVLGDKYEIIDLIATGGMGEIYLGIHRVLGKKRAIKIIHQSVEKEKDIRQRFLQEARHAASVDHPGIIQIMDFGSHDEFDYLIMPYIEGRTLQEKMREGPIEPVAAIKLMIAMTDAIAHTHRQNIIHRDIKPSNFMIDSEGRVILTDFGISKNLGDPNMTATNMILGSPKFMSPEQISGKSVDKRSDLYSLGMIFYQMVSGIYPFESQDMAALAYKQVHEVPPPASQVNPGVSEVLSGLIASLLEKNPDNRYTDGESLLKDLQRLNTGGTIGEAAAPGKSIEDMETRVVARTHPIEPPRENSIHTRGRLPDQQIPGASTKHDQKKLALISVIALFCIIAVGVGGLHIGWFKTQLAMIFDFTGPDLALRGKNSREKAILNALKTHNSPLTKIEIRRLCRLNIGVRADETADQQIFSDLRRFLVDIDFVTYIDRGGCDVLIDVKDHALGKKLIINSNLYGCDDSCGEEYMINADRLPFDKVEMLLKRNYCFNLFGILGLLSAEQGHAAMKLDIPGKAGNVFIIGEQVQFCLGPAFEAHSMLLDINIDGIFKLFPLDPKQRTQLGKNEMGCSRHIQVSPPLGNELIVALGSVEEDIISAYSQQFAPQAPVFAWTYAESAVNSAIDMSETLFVRLTEQRAGPWSAETRFIRVLNSN
jgi:serine/threonine protein kinase